MKKHKKKKWRKEEKKNANDTIAETMQTSNPK